MKNKLSLVNKTLTIIVRILVVALAIYMICITNYRNLGILAITFALTFYDLFVTKVLKINLDEKLKISLILFIFGAQCLGSVLDFYGKFLWWDTMLHTISGVIFFFIGVAVIYDLNKRTSNVKISNIIIIVFGICFALSTGVIWEIIEFTADTFLNQNMQVAKGMYGQDALQDTMIDLICVTIGASITAFIELFQRRKISAEKI